MKSKSSVGDAFHCMLWYAASMWQGALYASVGRWLFPRRNLSSYFWIHFPVYMQGAHYSSSDKPNDLGVLPTKRRNNASAKKSRDVRRTRELLTHIKLAFLKSENRWFLEDVIASKHENTSLRKAFNIPIRSRNGVINPWIRLVHTSVYFDYGILEFSICRI